VKVTIRHGDLRAVEAHGEATYPDEGAGFLLGRVSGESVHVEAVLPVDNRRESAARHNRYELAPRDFTRAEDEAARRGLDLVGIFHSHPDHPNQPSEFDREHAWPNLSYLITSVEEGTATGTRAWRLAADRAQFEEDTLAVQKS
jgi:proteasome lid subunit RPN8/RPN11